MISKLNDAKSSLSISVEKFYIVSLSDFFKIFYFDSAVNKREKN